MSQEEFSQLQKENDSLRKQISQQSCQIIILKTEIVVLRKKEMELLARIAEIQESKE